MSLRRADGFRRYALSVQYHGGSLLGFTFQGKQEDCILPDGTDLRGLRSVEGRIREALGRLFQDDHWENIQVSSRTDRGVHALKNTFHVDIFHPSHIKSLQEKRFTATTVHKDEGNCEVIQKLRGGLNFFLTRQSTSKSNGNEWWTHSMADNIRILSAKPAPDYMENYYSEKDSSQPPFVDWNARFSATQRTYIYRILASNNDSSMELHPHEWGVPFEWDRSWRVRWPLPMDISAMQEAAQRLQGTHDFSSFRGAKCQRHSPIVSIDSIRVESQPYEIPEVWRLTTSSAGGGLLGLGAGYQDSTTDRTPSPQLVTVSIVGNSFLYRQVRNMVACLVEVGKQNLRPKDVEAILSAKDRRSAPGMAPPHGLFLVDVKHGDFKI